MENWKRVSEQRRSIRCEVEEIRKEFAASAPLMHDVKNKDVETVQLNVEQMNHRNVEAKLMETTILDKQEQNNVRE